MEEENKNTQKTKLDELIDLRDELVEYYKLTGELARGNSLNTQDESRAGHLFGSIAYKSGYLNILLEELVHDFTIDVGGKSYNAWGIALRIPVDNTSWQATGFCIQLITRAIGILENELRSGIRDSKTYKLKPQVGQINFEPLKAFISHGHGEGALTKLERFVRELSIEPIIAKYQPNEDRTVDDKVLECLKMADFVIVLATGDDEIKTKDENVKKIKEDKKTKTFHPRQNIIHEIGLAQTTHPGKIIYLLEGKAEFPSNIKPKVYL